MCTYCKKPVTDLDTSLCSWHLDLELIVDLLNSRGVPVTIEKIIATIETCQGNGGSLIITPDDLPDLITPAVAEKYGITEAANV